MSHELRTPLNSIIGFSEVLQGVDSLDDKQKRYVQNIQKSGETLLEMINDILDLAKIESGKMEVRLTEFRIDNHCRAQCDMVRPLAEREEYRPGSSNRTRFAAAVSRSGQSAADPQEFAVATPSNSRRKVARSWSRVRADQQGLFELSVADTGVGIAEAGSRT